MVGIKKRDGRSENFVAEKIVVSAVKSGAPASVAREIAKKVEAEVKEDISTKDIKRMVLEMLREENPEWEKNWLIYDREVKKRIE